MEAQETKMRSKCMFHFGVCSAKCKVVLIHLETLDQTLEYNMWTSTRLEVSIMVLPEPIGTLQYVL